MVTISTASARFFVLLSLFSLVLVVSAPLAAAQVDACDDLIDLHGVDDPDGLIAAIAQAEAETGLDFHVFVADTLAAGQDLAAASFANCSDAYIVPGEVFDDTVVLAVAVEDRDFAVVYGSNLNDRLDDDVDAIFDRMAAWFQNGDFGAGLEAGVDEAVDGLETEPANTVGWLAGGAAGAAAVVGGGAALVGVRRKNNRKRTSAAAEYDEASSQVTDVQARWYDAEQTATLLGGRLTGSSKERLETAQVDAAEASRRLYDAWSPVSDLDGAQVAEFDDESRTEAFGHVSRAAAIAKENSEALQTFETALADLDGAVDEMETLQTVTTERLATARQAAIARSADGWDVTAAQQRLDHLEKALGHVDAFALRVDVDAVRPALEPLAIETDSIATDLEQLDERRDTETARRGAVANEASGQLTRVSAAATMIDGWKVTHAASSFNEVVGYPAEAAKQLERAQQLLREAEQVGEIPRNVGVLREVTADLDAADVAIDLADELLDNVDALDVELRTALSEAPAAVAEARSDAATLTNFLSTHRTDLGVAAQEAARLVTNDLAEAEAALAQSPPDSLLAIELAEDIGEDVDEQLAKFKTVVGEQERLRNAAHSQLRAAQTALDRADRHVDSHRFSDRASKSAQGQLDQLRVDFRQLQGVVATDPEQVIARARQIATAAEQLYHEAQRRQRNNRAAGPIIVGRGGFGGGFGGGILGGGTSQRRRSGGFGGGFGGGGLGGGGRSRGRIRPSGRSSPRRSSGGGRRSGGFKGGRSGKF